ncbi:hypothetical protein, partial [Streptomyces clavuligerus]
MECRGGALGAGAVLSVLVALAAGGVWWWALIRLVTAPERAGLTEGMVVAGGWGLSLLPVHVTAPRRRRGGLRPRALCWRGPRRRGAEGPGMP